MWRLQLLGPCRLECDAVSAAPSAKQQALLGLLGSAGPAGLTREHLIALLWEEAPRARARQSLRQLLSDLRRECAVVQVNGSEHVMLDQLCVSVDLWQFERAARSEDPEQLQQASSLYAGPLLQEIAVVGEGFEAWLTSERPASSAWRGRRSSDWPALMRRQRDRRLRYLACSAGWNWTPATNWRIAS